MNQLHDAHVQAYDGFWCDRHILEYLHQVEMCEWLRADAGLADDEFSGAFAESDLNGRPIDWFHWVHQVPRLTAAQAARLMSGLDPDLHGDLESLQNESDPCKALENARKWERIAVGQGMENSPPEAWIEWADRQPMKDDTKPGRPSLFVHPLFRIEAGKLKAKPPAGAPAVAVGESGGTPKFWTDERKAEARAYRDIHGLKKTAAYYKVSQTTISKHIPSGKAKQKQTGPWVGLGKI